MAILLLALPAAPQLSAPEWRESRSLIQAVLNHKTVANLRMRGDRQTRDALLVIPFVPAGTDFRLNGKPWKSIPWLTKAQRAKGNFLEVYSLYRTEQGTTYEGPRADVEIFFRPSNYSFHANFSFRGKAWKLNDLDAKVY